MPDVKEVYEMVTQQAPPKPDALGRQRKRQNRAATSRKMGAFAVAAGIGAAAMLIGIQLASEESTPRPAITPPPTAAPPGHSPDMANLYVIDPETGDATVLLDAEGAQWDPERSPDGTRLVYTSYVSGQPQIFVLEGDGTQRQLTDLRSGALNPTWSPDGSQIAFATRGRGADIFVMSADGADIRRLAGTPIPDGDPDWSPDGTQIAFSTHSLGNNVWVASVADGTVTQLTHGADESWGPAWSPDGTWIAFAHVRDVGKDGDIMNNVSELWLMRRDGSEQHRIASGVAQGAAWSPDGRSIVVNEWPSDVSIIDVESGEERDISPPGEIPLPVRKSWEWIGGLHGMSWGPDGILMSLK